MLQQDYREMLQVLRESGVEYIIVGAFALAAHGFPRSTADLDIWINPTRENSVKLFTALQKFGAPLSGIIPDDFVYKNNIFQIGVAPCRIDIITGISGEIDFSEAYNNASLIELGEVKEHILSIRDLIKNKESTGREKDMIDAELLKKRIKIED
jgi:hypothetical protein